ncbi:MAG: hypothetical protein DMF63_05325 [Acidobacteria bacterium]|nr:MAG: hypothetical protein DMF63_05325 [Acidobacteriota bacterium]
MFPYRRRLSFFVLDVGNHASVVSIRPGGAFCRGSSRYLRRIDASGCDKFFVLLGRGVEAKTIFVFTFASAFICRLFDIRGKEWRLGNASQV